MPRTRPKRVLKVMQTASTKEGEVPFLLIRSSARRTWSICVDEQAKVSVSVPYHSPLKDIHRFVREKSRWITKSVATALKNRDYLNGREYADGREFLFLGKKYKLRVRYQQVKRPRVHFDGLGWEITLPDGSAQEERRELIKKKMVQWYRAQAQEILGGRIFHYARIMGVKPSKIGIRTQKRLWGCCDYNTQTINLNWQIILSPIKVVDYVVVHELCHLSVPNHSRRFWKKVEEVMPDYREYKAWLKKNFLDMVLP